MDDNVKVVPGTEDVFANVTSRVGLPHGLLHASDDVQHLTADVDEGHLGLDGVGGNDDALDEGVRGGSSPQM